MSEVDAAIEEAVGEERVTAEHIREELEEALIENAPEEVVEEAEVVEEPAEPAPPPPYMGRITELTVTPTNGVLYDQLATKIEVVDEGAGEFVKVIQEGGHISVDHESWPTIRQNIDLMFTRFVRAQ